MDHTQYTTNNAERKPGKHLTREDRGAIEAMKKLGQSNRAIARYSPTTVSKEPLNQSAAALSGSFAPTDRFENLEIRKDFQASIWNKIPY